MLKSKLPYVRDNGRTSRRTDGLTDKRKTAFNAPSPWSGGVTVFINETIGSP